MQSEHQARGGSALIIVLGFLSILLLIVFSFSVKMQTEYRVARSSENNFRSEFVMLQGIHLSALEFSHATPVSGFTNMFYPRCEVLESEGVLLGSPSFGAITNFLVPPADSFVPPAVFDLAMTIAQSNYLGILPQLYGGSVSDPISDLDGNPSTPNLIVAVAFEPSGAAYCILNNSGYLDINAPYGTASGGRKYGTNINEINLTDILSPTAISSMPGARSQFGRIESMMELYAYSNSFGFSSHDMAMFAPYSHARLGQYWSTNLDGRIVDAVSLTGGVNSVASTSTAVKAAFALAGLNQDIAVGSLTVPAARIQEWLLTNLLDYIDADIAPRGLMQPSQEAVAGLNEIGIQSLFSCTKIADSPSQYRYDFRLSNLLFEVWNPYCAPNVTRTYQMPLVPAAITINHLTGPGFASQNNTPFMCSTSIGPRTITNLTPAVSFPLVQAITTATNMLITYRIRFSPLSLNWGTPATAVDRVGNVGSFFYLYFSNSLPSMPTGINQTVTSTDTYSSYEAVDPRFNWVATNDVYWVSRTGWSMGQTNQATLAWITNPANITDYTIGDDIEKATYAFSADTNLTVIGELGYLAVAPWRTVRLTKGSQPGQNVDAVLDTFTLNPIGAAARGLINPNTCFTGVLQAVFNGQRMDMYPGEPMAGAGGTCSNLSSSHASMLASRMLQYTRNTSSSETALMLQDGLNHEFLNVSDLGNADTIFQDPSFLSALSANYEFKREAIIRNSAGLFSTRNMTYTVVLWATDEICPDISGGIADSGNNFLIGETSVMAAQRRAAAMVVRDPWSKETFIRHFRHLPADGILLSY